jgi:hypothetical protein
VLSDGDGNPRIWNNGKTHLGLSSTDYGIAIGTTNTNTWKVDIAFNPNTGNGTNCILTTPSVSYGSYYFAWMNNHSGSQVGAIICSTSSTSYNTSSDYRLKENVVDLTGAAARVQQLAPKRFNFIVNADTTVDGFLAHEVQSVVPEAITGTHNEVDADGNPVYQGIDQSKLVPLLTAALQEALTKIDALETRIVALETN